MTMKNTVHKKIFLCLLLITGWGCQAQENNMKSISKNEMNVSWFFSENRIHFTMSAPTNGWVTIGFNTHTGTKDAYLIMGNVAGDKVKIAEHYTLDPGNYKPIATLGASPQVQNATGFENSNKTVLRFSLPKKSFSKYQKDLSQGKEYTMILAFSREDDFQHHSIMRTSINVKL